MRHYPPYVHCRLRINDFAFSYDGPLAQFGAWITSVLVDHAIGPFVRITIDTFSIDPSVASPI